MPVVCPVVYPTGMLTDRQIQSALRLVNAKCSAHEEVLNDGAAGRGTGSLQLRIRRTSEGTVTATWFGRWKRDGKPAKKALGRYPDVPLKEARDKFAEEVRAALSAGKNPRAMAPASDARPTVQALFEGYVTDMRGNDCNSADEVERALLTGKYAAVKDLGADRMAGTVEPGDISNHLAKAFKRGARVMADRARAYLHRAFQWGAEAANDYRVEMRRDWGIKANPVDLVPRDSGATRKRDRALARAEVYAVWHGFQGKGYAPETVGAARLILCCGQRVRETLRACGADFDLEEMIWTLPSLTTKGGHPHRVPLPPQAKPVVQELMRIHGKGQLFPARTEGDNPHLTEGAVNKALRRWQKKTGAARFQTRDLRRTWKSRAGDAGVDRFTRDLIQQHAQAEDTGSRVYDHTDYMPHMRAAMKTWGEWLAGVLADERQAQAQRKAA